MPVSAANRIFRDRCGSSLTASYGVPLPGAQAPAWAPFFLEALLPFRPYRRETPRDLAGTACSQELMPSYPGGPCEAELRGGRTEAELRHEDKPQQNCGSLSYLPGAQAPAWAPFPPKLCFFSAFPKVKRHGTAGAACSQPLRTAYPAGLAKQSFGADVPKRSFGTRASHSNNCGSLSYLPGAQAPAWAPFPPKLCFFSAFPKVKRHRFSPAPRGAGIAYDQPLRMAYPGRPCEAELRHERKDMLKTRCLSKTARSSPRPLVCRSHTYRRSGGSRSACRAAFPSRVRRPPAAAAPD